MKRKQACSLAILAGDAGRLSEQWWELVSGLGCQPPGLSRSAQDLLRAVQRHGPLSMPELAKRRRVSRQRVRCLVQELVGGGWLELRPNPAHRRSALVGLTGEGGERLEAWQQAELAALRGLPLAVSRKRLEGAARVVQSACRELEQAARASRGR